MIEQIFHIAGINVQKIINNNINESNLTFWIIFTSGISLINFVCLMSLKLNSKFNNLFTFSPFNLLQAP